MTTFPNERIQRIIQETFPDFLEHWVNKYPTFEEAWNHCHSGVTMVGVLSQYAPDAPILHWLGLRAARRALGILNIDDQMLEFQKIIAIKELWLMRKVSDSVLERERDIVSLISVGADREATRTMGVDGSLKHPFGFDMFLARAMLLTCQSWPADAVLATNPAGSAFRTADHSCYTKEMQRQADDARELFPSSFFVPTVVRKSRYEREWVI